MASNHVMNAQPEFLVDETKSYLYNKLWRLCAGPLVGLPKFGEKVYYFPQGHIEQLEASTNNELAQIQPLFNIPSKIPCNVIGIKLNVEKHTNELYAEVALLPDTVEVGIPIPNRNQENLQSYYFTKVLSVSDTSPHGGLSVLRKHALECLPLLDMSHPTPTQEIIAKDLHGREWRFKHIFRGTPRRHLFTTGWNAFVTANHLVAGDCFIFLRGENGETLIGARRVAHRDDNIPLLLISSHTIYHGVIASAMNAIDTKSMFTVFYKPRSSQFIVSFDKFLDAVNNKFNINSTFTMLFEDDEFNEKRYYGKITEIEDFSSYWRNSEWRNLKVQWDKAASIQTPNRISSWDIELLAPSSSVLESSLLKNKRQCQLVEISSNLWTPTLTQGQEIGQSSMNALTNSPQFSYHDSVDDSKISSGWLMNYIVPTNETTAAATGYKLFGVDLEAPTNSKDIEGLIDTNEKSEISKIYEENKFDQTQGFTIPKKTKNKQISSHRSRTKVQMQGIAVGRTVDLTVLGGYNELIDELEKLFDLKDKLRIPNQWEIIFTDDEEDMMLVGDDPW
ncbi:unnamed protein product, partial [Thlaspi arvense]